MLKHLNSSSVIICMAVLSLLSAGCKDKPKFKAGYSDATQLDPAKLKADAETAKKAKEDAELKAAKEKERAADLAKLKAELKAEADAEAKKKAEAGAPVVVPSTDAPKVETPRAETPKIETPKVETPKVETPKVEVPKLEVPKAEAPKQEDELEVEASVGTGTPKVEAPKDAGKPAEDEAEVETGVGEAAPEAAPAAGTQAALVNPPEVSLNLKLESGNNQSIATKVSCVASGDLAKASKSAITLLNGSRVMLAAANEKSEDHAQAVSCHAEKSEADLKKASESVGLISLLAVGNATSFEAIIAEGTEMKSAKLEVTCHKDATTVNQNLRGIALLAGSRIVISQAAADAKTDAKADSAKTTKIVIGCVPVIIR